MNAIALSLSVVLLLITPIHAVENNKVILNIDSFENIVPDNEIGGIILDRTITLMGKTFYKNFVSYWHLNFPNNVAVFSIHERPSARWGSQIWINYRGKKLLKQFVSPRNTNDKELPEQIAKQINKEIVKMQLTEKLMDTFDMEHNEI